MRLHIIFIDHLVQVILDDRDDVGVIFNTKNRFSLLHGLSLRYSDYLLI